MSEQIKNIIVNLSEATISNDIEWKLSNSLFNSDTEKYYETFSVDQKTRFVVKMSLDESFNFQSADLHLHNKDLINGAEYLYFREYSQLNDLGKAVFNKYVKPNLIQKNQNATYDSILSNIFSKQHKRDQRIDAILGDESQTEDKPKSILNKLFGK